MADVQTKASLDALYKEVYAGKLNNLRPDFGILTEKIKFKEAKKTGRKYNQPVVLTHEHGFTYGGGLQQLKAAVVAESSNAEIQGNSLTLRTAFSYEAAANMLSGGKEAFTTATQYRFKSMMEAATYRLEAQMINGDSGLGVIDSADDGADKVVIKDSDWAPGIWAGSERASIDIYSADGLTLRVGNVEVVSVDAALKTLQLAIGTDLSSVVDTDVIHFSGAKGEEMVGLRNIVSNAGNLYGINGANYSLWQGNVSDVGGALTLKKIYQGVNRAVGKGLREDIDVLVSPATFSSLAADEAALRRYNANSKKAENGFDSIQYFGPSGVIKIIVHPMMREGEAIAFPMKDAERIGATDITFKTPGRSDEMFLQMPEHNGYECRLYSEQALFLPCPAKGILFSGITNV